MQEYTFTKYKSFPETGQKQLISFLKTSILLFQQKILSKLLRAIWISYGIQSMPSPTKQIVFSRQTFKKIHVYVKEDG